MSLFYTLFNSILFYTHKLFSCFLLHKSSTTYTLFFILFLDAQAAPSFVLLLHSSSSSSSPLTHDHGTTWGGNHHQRLYTHTIPISKATTGHYTTLFRSLHLPTHDLDRYDHRAWRHVVYSWLSRFSQQQHHHHHQCMVQFNYTTTRSTTHQRVLPFPCINIDNEYIFIYYSRIYVVYSYMYTHMVPTYHVRRADPIPYTLYPDQRGTLSGHHHHLATMAIISPSSSFFFLSSFVFCSPSWRGRKEGRRKENMGGRTDHDWMVMMMIPNCENPFIVRTIYFCCYHRWYYDIKFIKFIK